MAYMPPEAQEYYGAAMAQVRTHATQIARYGAPLEKVAKVVVQALTASHPKPRYTVS